MQSKDSSSFDYRAAFIGPQGENADEMERMVLEVLRDRVMWHRNFHPEDQRLVGEWARTERPFRETTAKLRDELYAVLARLKRGAPLHSTRPGSWGIGCRTPPSRQRRTNSTASGLVNRQRHWNAPLVWMVVGLLVFEAVSGLSIWLLPFSVSNQFLVLIHTAGGVLFLPPRFGISLPTGSDFGGLGSITSR